MIARGSRRFPGLCVARSNPARAAFRTHRNSQELPTPSALVPACLERVLQLNYNLDRRNAYVNAAAGVRLHLQAQGWPVGSSAHSGEKKRYVSGKTRKDVATKLSKVVAERDSGLVYDLENLIGCGLPRQVARRHPGHAAWEEVAAARTGTANPPQASNQEHEARRFQRPSGAISLPLEVGRRNLPMHRPDDPRPALQGSKVGREVVLVAPQRL